jgi:glycine hydroxymethyltransferase
MATNSPSASRLTRYLNELSGNPIVPSVAAFLAGLDAIEAQSPVIDQAIVTELRDQRSNLKLIASENYCSLATQLAMGNLLTDKYAEGFSGHRFYAGCDNVDTIESEATISRASCSGRPRQRQPHSAPTPHGGVHVVNPRRQDEAPFLAATGDATPRTHARKRNSCGPRLQISATWRSTTTSGGTLLTATA